MSRIKEVQQNVEEYYSQIDWEPVIERTWVESYLNVLHFNKRTDEQIDAWEDIHALISYIDRTTYSSVSDLLWWDYSVALEWINDHIWMPDRFDLTLENARRMLGRWLDFYSYLFKAWDSKIDLSPIEYAYFKICSGSKLKLVKKIPYTGDEFWLGTTRVGSDLIVDFTMAEFWLILAYHKLGESWDKLEEELKGVPSVREKRKRLSLLWEKLELAGYRQNPIDLVRGHVKFGDLEDAEKWFYWKRIPQQ
ncbi:trigger factor [Ferroacidibacillus organovorans]|uniref:Trigger factor n=1 Tax=Ferroacidibacillus organovorans TaxID=1765683 RepID=A0A117SXF2_9BACL|nr:trigger factor [Ferroacidibacillus organovorans]KUO95328.1 trigger factor [Ferroacidibacillus organovorans]